MKPSQPPNAMLIKLERVSKLHKLFQYCLKMGVLIYYSFKESCTYTNKNLNDEEEKEIKAHAVTYPEMNEEGNLFFFCTGLSYACLSQ